MTAARIAELREQLEVVEESARRSREEDAAHPLHADYYGLVRPCGRNTGMLTGHRPEVTCPECRQALIDAGYMRDLDSFYPDEPRWLTERRTRIEAEIRDLEDTRA